MQVRLHDIYKTPRTLSILGASGSYFLPSLLQLSSLSSHPFFLLELSGIKPTRYKSYLGEVALETVTIYSQSYLT